jgi:hypothetical protein
VRAINFDLSNLPMSGIGRLGKCLLKILKTVKLKFEMKKVKKTVYLGLLTLSFMGIMAAFYPQEAQAACSGSAPNVCVTDACGNTSCTTGVGTQCSSGGIGGGSD